MRALRHGWVLPAVLTFASCAGADRTEPVMTVVYRDLDLASAHDRQTLDERVARATHALCEREAEERQLGPAFNRFNRLWCIEPTRKSIVRALSAAMRKKQTSIRER